MDGRDGNSFQGPGDQRWEGVLDPAAGYRCLPLDHTLWPLTEPLHPLDQRMEQLYASTVICKEIVFYMTIQIDPSWFKIWGIIPKQILLYCQQITLNFCTWMGNICPGFKLFTLWLWMKCFCLNTLSYEVARKQLCIQYVLQCDLFIFSVWRDVCGAHQYLWCCSEVYTVC